MEISRCSDVEILNDGDCDNLSDLISDFTQLKLEESKQINQTFKTMSQNAHGFLQRTTHRKSNYMQRNLSKIFKDLHGIYLQDKNTNHAHINDIMNALPNHDDNAQNESKYDYNDFERNMTDAKNQGSIKSLNLSRRKDSAQQSLLYHNNLNIDNLSLKANDKLSLNNFMKQGSFTRGNNNNAQV